MCGSRKDWGRVLCLDPQADVEVFAALQREIRAGDREVEGSGGFDERMQDSFSGVVQLSPVIPALTGGRVPAEEIEVVARVFWRRQAATGREPAGQTKDSGNDARSFEKAGVLEFLNAIPAAPYTKAGDPSSLILGTGSGARSSCFMRCR